MTAEPARRQARLNAASRDRWAAYAPHRRQVTALALRAGRADGRLCVLGAGNVNDLDLAALTDAYAEVRLIDLDAEALAAGVAAQGLADRPRLTCQGGVDLSGVLGLIDGWPGSGPDEAAVDALVERLEAGAPALPGESFDTVVSACLLTQLLEPLLAALGPEHPRLEPAVTALRRAHLDQMIDLTVPGGQAILVSDLVSSETVPGLAEMPPDRLKPLALELLEARNFFTGANPVAILQALEADPATRATLKSAGLVEPWLWQQQPDRCYLVYAIVLERKG